MSWNVRQSLIDALAAPVLIGSITTGNNSVRSMTPEEQASAVAEWLRENNNQPVLAPEDGEDSPFAFVTTEELADLLAEQ
ncbi:hypothetical protein LCGC14_0397130 [marine sediment metagenome]|uniref:Uncharacterized protein n=1 Tax=marine sediment metagenome TaxID=412755 RepID=A0A0F9SXZ9_9ZZZZ